jgi:hypothetical protein
MLGLLLFSFISKHNICSYYDWVCRFCRQSVNTTCGRNKVEFVFVVVVSKIIYGRIMVGFVVVVVDQ